MPRRIDRPEEFATPVSLGDALARSARFKDLFSEGMALVEEAAGYLDGPGRTEARVLPPAMAAAYSAESMRLTTRLMQVASWLLIRRAVMEGEMTASDAHAQRVKVTLSAQSRVSSATIFAQLPPTLRELTERSLRMQQRVLHIDRMVNAESGDAPPAIVNTAREDQFAMLRSAYPGHR